jgi:enamine deaminase RidA (YjgF/YER057c/UK114 family)
MTILYQNPANLKHRSDTVIHNNIAYLSGVIPTDNAADITTQTEQVLAQLDERLSEAGSGKDKILSATIWMRDVNRDVSAFNEVWNQWVVPGRLPVRSCVQATVQYGVLLEIAVIAAV